MKTKSATQLFSATLIAALVSASFMITTPAKAGPMNPSEASALSAGLTASVIVMTPFLITTYLSKLAVEPSNNSERRNLRVQNITHKDNNRTLITATATYDNNTSPMEFEVDTTVAKEAGVMPGQYLTVKTLNQNYVLKAGDKTLAIVEGDPTRRTFRQQKLQ